MIAAADGEKEGTNGMPTREEKKTRTEGMEEKEGPLHVAVLLKEVVAQFEGRHIRSFVDCTLGAGGHASAVSVPKAQTLDINLLFLLKILLELCDFQLSSSSSVYDFVPVKNPCFSRSSRNEGRNTLTSSFNHTCLGFHISVVGFL
jgi:hypothetical protein